MSKKPSPRMEQLDAVGIDRICEMIMDDQSYAAICAKLKIPSVGSLCGWLNADIERSARAREARVKSAQQCDNLALVALEAITDDAPNGMVVRQREIASHYRWRAKVRNPREYGEKVQVDADITVSAMTEAQLLEKAKALADKLGLAIPVAESAKIKE